MDVKQLQQFVFKDKLLWSGRPSLWINAEFGLYVLLLIWVPIINLIMGLKLIWRYIKVLHIKYELFEDRLQVSQGVFTKYVDNVFLYRIKDVQIYKLWWWRMVGFGGLLLITSDKSNPMVLLKCVPHVDELYEAILNASEHCRQTNKVREVDFR